MHITFDLSSEMCHSKHDGCVHRGSSVEQVDSAVAWLQCVQRDNKASIEKTV